MEFQIAPAHCQTSTSGSWPVAQGVFVTATERSLFFSFFQLYFRAGIEGFFSLSVV